MAGRTLRMWVLGVVVAAVLLLVGCSGSVGTEQAHRGSVDTTTQVQVMSALATAGVTPEATSELRMTWKQGAGETVVVDGRFVATSPKTSSGSYAAIYEVRRRPHGAWTVRQVK